MKIGFFTATYYPTPDGVSHYLRDVKHELEEMGHEVHVFSFNGDRSEKNVHVPMSVPFPSYPQYNMPINPFPMYLYKIASKVDFDVIHIHDPFMGSIGYRLARAKKIPVFATFHTDFVRMKESLKMPLKETLFHLSWRYNSYLYKRCNLVLAPSSKALEYLKESGIKNSRELPLFVDTWKFNTCKRDIDPYIVQYLGRITRDKGVFRVLDIAEQFRGDMRFKFIIAGTGPDAENLMKEAKKRNLTENLEFTGYVDESTKLELLSNANLFMYPSETDTFGISVLEALSSGLPSMVPLNFPLTHYTEGKESGIITVDFQDPESVKETLLELRNNHQRMAELYQVSRSFATEKFSKEHHCEELLSIYGEFGHLS